MKATVSVQAHVRELQLGYFVGEQFFLVTEDNIKVEADRLNCSPKLLDLLCLLVGDIRQVVGQDLIDIWERVDSLEQQMERRYG